MFCRPACCPYRTAATLILHLGCQKLEPAKAPREGSVGATLSTRRGPARARVVSIVALRHFYLRLGAVSPSWSASVRRGHLLLPTTFFCGLKPKSRERD